MSSSQNNSILTPKPFLSICFTLLLLCLKSNLAFAAYTVQTVAGEAFDTVSTNVVWTNDPAQTGYPTDDDYELVNIGFTFYLGETAYTQVRVLANGALHFGADQGFHKDFNNEALAITNACTGTCPGFEEPADRAILGYWDDLEPSLGGTIRYGTLGSSPNRRFVASWENVPRFNGPATSYSFQIVIYENGNVRFRYGNDDANGSNATIGIEVDDSDFTQHSFNTNSVSDANDLLWVREFPNLDSATANCTTTNKVTLSFASAISPARANDASNFSIDNGISVLSASYINSTTVELTTDTLTSGTTYTVSTIYPNQNTSFVLGTLANTTFSDQFNAVSYTNNDGSGVWTGGWVEIDDDGSPSSGNVTIAGNELRLDDSPNSGGEPSIYREADLSGFTSATLTFDYDTPNNLENGDRFDILVSSNGGISYTVIDTFSDDVSGSASYDITAYIASNTRIRFSVENGFGGSGERMEIDNVSITATGITPCAPLIHHYEIEHDGSGLTCLAENITIKSCLDAGCTTLSSDSVNLDFYAGAILISSPTFTGSTVVSLSQLTPAILTLSVANPSIAPSNPFECDSGGGGSSCNIDFSEAGFILSLADHKSCAIPNLTIQAVKIGETGTSCAPAYTGNQSVDFVFNYVTPVIGSPVPQLSGSNLAGATITQNRTINFNASATATLPFQYLDAGQLSLTVSDAAGAGLSSATVSPKISPTKLLISTSDANNSCADANCSVFKVAGVLGNAASEFNLTVAGACADDTVTPNFQMNNIALTSSVALPFGGNIPALGVNSVNITTNGSVTVTQTASEVGAFTFTATPTENYLITETVLAGTSSVIGRFTPAYFDFNGQTATLACGGFSYGGFLDGINPLLDKNGQTFTISGQIQAKNSAGTITANYTGTVPPNNFLKFDQTAVLAAGYDNATSAPINTINFSVAPGNFIDNGNGTINYSDPNAHYQFASLRAPLDLFARMNVTDSDLITTNANWDTNVVEQRLGRLLLFDSYGPETSPLEMRLQTEYYDGASWLLNAPDSCTTYSEAIVSFGAFTENVNAGNTSITPIGVQTVSAGVSSIANGLWFGATGNYGTARVDLDLSAQSWLQFDWDADNTIDTTTGILNYGYYRGSDRVIYWQEQ